MLLFATGNKHKFAEVSKVLAEYGIELKQANPEMRELKSIDPKKIALGKARQAFAQLRQPVIAEDTGIWFTACRNFPGTQPKSVFESLGFEGLLSRIKGKSRKAFFLCTICFFDGSQHKFFEGRLEGRISTKIIKPKADRMPYEKIFIPICSKKALVEMAREEKNAISHRGIAARKLGEWLMEKNAPFA